MQSEGVWLKLRVDAWLPLDGIRWQGKFIIQFTTRIRKDLYTGLNPKYEFFLII